MRKVTFFILLFSALSWALKVQAQTFTTSLDTLVATFNIPNKRATPVTSDAGADYAQKHAEDLRFILDKFFNTTQYRKGRSIEVTQYRINAIMSKNKKAVDSFLSVVYILDVPDAATYNEKLKADTFLNVKGGPTEIPELFYISTLDDKRLILVSVRAYLYKDYEEAVRKRERTKQYLYWLREQYR